MLPCWLYPTNYNVKQPCDCLKLLKYKLKYQQNKMLIIIINRPSNILGFGFLGSRVLGLCVMWTLEIKIDSSERTMWPKWETKKNNWDSLSKHSLMMWHSTTNSETHFHWKRKKTSTPTELDNWYFCKLDLEII